MYRILGSFRVLDTGFRVLGFGYPIHHYYTVGRKIKKSPGQKNLEINLTKFHFLQFQKWPKINFGTGKKLKTAKNAISRKKIFDLGI